ncbi:hypothetical protein VTN02DRAFT_4532 [Thermoascus thermophilus]
MASQATIIVIGGSSAGIGVSHGILKQVPAAKVILVYHVYVSATGVMPSNRSIPSVFLHEDGWVRFSSRNSDQVPVVITDMKAEVMGQQKRATYPLSDKVMVILPVGKSGGTRQLGSWPFSFKG